MEIAEIEQIIEACNFDVASQTQRAETFNVIDAIVEMRNTKVVSTPNVGNMKMLTDVAR